MKNNMKKIRTTAIVTIVLGMVLLIGSIVLNGSEKITQTKTEVTIELGSTSVLPLNATDFFDVDRKEAQKINFDTTKVDMTKVGEYGIIATYKKQKYNITAKITDTTKPEVELAESIVFTNDIEKANAGIESILADIKDASDYTAKLIRFEKKDVLSTMDLLAVSRLKESIADFGTDTEALSVGTTEIPTQPGIYRSVLEVADVYGNASYREVYVILDKTGAVINDVADMVVTVPKEKLEERPELNLSLYKGYDEVDGLLNSSQLIIDLVLKDGAKHEWTVSVAYTDRAGNESQREFFVTVTEEKNQVAADNNENHGGNAGNKGDSVNQGDNSNTALENNQGSTADKDIPADNNSNTQYDPADANKDGWVDADEELRYITPEKQACIDAGYGVVCEFDGGEWYAVLMKNDWHMISGKDGTDILRDYLHEKDLEGHISGCWINSDNEWYWFVAKDIHEWITEEDAEFWN